MTENDVRDINWYKLMEYWETKDFKDKGLKADNPEDIEKYEKKLSRECTTIETETYEINYKLYNNKEMTVYTLDKEDNTFSYDDELWDVIIPILKEKIK